MKIGKYIFYLALALFTWFILVKPLFVNPYLLRSNFEYTVGTVIEKKSSANGDADYVYNYYINGKEHSGIFGINPRDEVHVKDCYLVKYLPSNPSISEIQLQRPVNCNDSTFRHH